MSFPSASLSAIDIYDPMDSTTLVDPYQAYRRLRDECPVGFLEPLNVWVISQYGDVRAVLADNSGFSAASAFGSNWVLRDKRHPSTRINLAFSHDATGVVSSTDGRDHLRLRRMVAPLLARPSLEDVEAAVGKSVMSQLAKLRGRPEFDFVAEVARPVAIGSVGALMGMDDATVQALCRWVETTFRSLDPGDELSAGAPRQDLVGQNLNSMRALQRFVADKRRDPGDHPMDRLVTEWRLAPFLGTERELILSLLQLFQAAYETILASLGCLGVVLASDNDLLRMRDHSKTVAGLADEILRLGSPVRATFRGALRTSDIGGVSVPADAMVMVLLGSANRDDRVFAKPDSVDLERAGRGHIGFGAGTHQCLGSSLARLEVGQVLTAISEMVGEVRLAGDPGFKANIVKFGYDSLPMKVRWKREGP